jgi:Trk K+ transport system NAD-binding subunit
MKRSSTRNPVTYIVLRYMRTPIMLLIGVYAASMLGWVLIPAVDAEGNPQPMTFFHAFYFLTYTATTTGFGELPYTFNEAQRMWGIASLYASVIAWLYSIGAIIRLVRSPHFLSALDERRFARRVDRITEPFVIICGFGQTGSLLTRGLSDAGITAVILDQDSERIEALHLREYRVPMHGLCADARVPHRLVDAGLMLPNCRAVVALTRNEEVNLKIAVTARLMHPDLQVVSQSCDVDYAQVLATLGGDTHVIDPFQTYARYLGATILDPGIHTISQWLAGSPGATLDKKLRPPRGRWILCGYGRMGHRINEALEQLDIHTVVIEPNAGDWFGTVESMIVGRANIATLKEAQVESAVGVVAGTDNDPDNLSILINARSLNPDVFVVVRQNRPRNEIVFEAATGDFIMQPSLVSARRILFLLIAPLLKSFYEELLERRAGGQENVVVDTIDELRSAVGGTAPRVWTVDTSAEMAPALTRAIAKGRTVTLGDLVRDPSNREARLSCVPMVVKDGEREIVMPALSQRVTPGMDILCCGSRRAQRLVEATLPARTRRAACS